MADQREDAVRKGAHWAWQIHYHMVFPVTYRKALLDEEVTGIIQETAAEIADRFPIPHAPWHFLNFFPLPQGQGSLRPTLSYWCFTVLEEAGSSPRLRERRGGI
jgi:hypothetical protein